jgi:hypothetical protein
MRISVVEKNSTNKHQNSPSSIAKTRTGHKRSPRSEFYIRSDHISRKPKSPFRKYESCVSETFKSTNYLSSYDASEMEMSKRLEDLVFPCVDNTPQTPNHPITKESTTISDIKNEERIVKIEIVNQRSQVSRETKNFFYCNCKSKLEHEKKIVHFDESDQEKSQLDNMKLSPETAEQFMDILVAEDVILRKKIADGQVDDKILKGLERLTELRQKYMKYKEDEKKVKKDESKHLLSYNPMVLRQKSSVSLSDPSFSQELKRHPLVKF